MTSCRGEQPVAEIVPNTQPNPRRNSKFIYGNELRVPFRAHPSDGVGIPPPSSSNASLIKMLASIGEFESQTDPVHEGDPDGGEGDCSR